MLKKCKELVPIILVAVDWKKRGESNKSGYDPSTCLYAIPAGYSALAQVSLKHLDDSVLISL